MEWYFAENNQPKPIAEDALADKIQSRELPGETLVVNEELKNWVRLDTTDIWKKHTGADDINENISESENAEIFSFSEKVVCKEGKNFRIFSKIGFFSGAIGILTVVDLYRTYMYWSYPTLNKKFLQFITYLAEKTQISPYYWGPPEIFIICLSCLLSLLFGTISFLDKSNAGITPKKFFENRRLLGLLSIIMGSLLFILIIRVIVRLQTE